MTKTILTSASIFAITLAAPALGQSTSTLDQTSLECFFDVLQNVDNDISNIIHSGTGGIVTVTQGS